MKQSLIENVMRVKKAFIFKRGVTNKSILSDRFLVTQVYFSTSHTF